jgi:long-chain acyl-CoA synthetase
MTLGDKQKSFVSAFINIDINTIGPWAEQRNIGYTTFTDLSQNLEIRELIRTEILKVNSFLSDESKIKRFINLPKELDPDENELTRSRKIRRKFLEEKYVDFIVAIYNHENAFFSEVSVKYQDGRSGKFNTKVYINDLEENDSITFQ